MLMCNAGCALTQDVTLSPIHYRAVQRIYGEHGQQMVKLVRENPAYAIPIVFKRLLQKDSEWCAARNPCPGQGNQCPVISTVLSVRSMHLARKHKESLDAESCASSAAFRRKSVVSSQTCIRLQVCLQFKAAVIVLCLFV